MTEGYWTRGKSNDAELNQPLHDALPCMDGGAWASTLSH